MRFKLISGNWHGASGTWNGSGDDADDANHHAGENAGRVPLGLDRAPLAEIVAGFRSIGLNSLRLPFSGEMLHDTRPVTDAAVAANPGFRGMTPLRVYDEVVAAATAAGLAVIINNHTNTTRWCCGVDGNERWNASQSTAHWEDDWLFMVRRYRDNPRVVGADLYNEVRRSVWDDPNWGGGDDHDWFAASQRLGDRILREANPNLLIIVEGINWTGIPVDGFAHGRPTLRLSRHALAHPRAVRQTGLRGALLRLHRAEPHRRDRCRRDQRPAVPRPEPRRPRRRPVPRRVLRGRRARPALHRPGVDQRVRRGRERGARLEAARLVRRLHRPARTGRRRLRLLA
nr:hypothetical protein GCM10020092_066100 [Actinoplanes digitatis]